MKNYETSQRVFDRRKFMIGAGLGLSSLAIAGCGINSESIQAPSLSLVSTEVPPPPLPPVETQTNKSEQLHARWQEIINGRSGRIDIAVFDSISRQTSRAGNGNERFKTASIIKLSILERLLMLDPVWAHDNVNSIKPMITESNNQIAQNLWSRVGGTQSMQEFFNVIGSPGTTAGVGGNLFSTMTTAADQVKVASVAAYPGVLSPENVDFTKNLMHQVVPDQRWGISAGLPPGVIYENKNGWVDDRRHSIGHVSGLGVDYTIAVLTDDGPSASYDIDTIEELSATTWKTMSAQV